MPNLSEWIDQAKAELSSFRIDELVKSGIIPDGYQFMPVITYPPITMYPPADPETIFNEDKNPPDLASGVYVHIPFCMFQCHYCHWIKLINPPDDEVEDYLESLSMEMDLVTRKQGVDRIPVSSALFGGGTPTYLSPRQLEKVLKDFVAHIDLTPCRQFSFEAEPTSILGDQGFEKLKLLKSFGVNRISMGVQSFEDPMLEEMGRHHLGAQALEAIEQIRKAGIESISIDLIYGYPGQSVNDWVHTLNTALSAGVDAWHLYRLRILQHGDNQGPILDQYNNETERFADLDTIYLMKALGAVISEQNGYKQHFTRIFSTSQQHITQFMWDYCCLLTNVVGIGISSWSNYHRTFTQNVGGNFEKYHQMVRSGRLPVDRGIYRDMETEVRRSLIMPLKNDRVYKKRFSDRTGLHVNEHFASEIARLKNFGLIEEDENSLFLSPRGRFFADQTVMQLHQKRFLPFPELAHDLMPD